MTEKERIREFFTQNEYTRDEIVAYLVGYLSRSHLQMKKGELLAKISDVKMILDCAMELPTSADAFLVKYFK